MPLIQILRSRVQFAIPLLRQSIRVNNSSGVIHPRCFVTTLPRTQEIETITAAEAIVEAAVEKISEDSVQNENSPSPPPLALTPPAQQNPYPRRFVFRRVKTTPSSMVAIDTISNIQAARTRPEGALEQGYSIVRISKFIEVLRDPTVLPLGAAIVRRVSLDTENRLVGKTFILHINDIIKEREFLQAPGDSTQSPIMAKLGITSIEDDGHRYIVENLRDVGLGSANCLDPKTGYLINRWKRIEFFGTRRLVENIEAIRKTPKDSNVIFEWQGGKFVSLPLIETLEKIAGEQRYLIHAIRRAAGVPDPGLLEHILSWSPDLFNNLMRLLRKAERQTSAILKDSTGGSTATVVGESTRYDLPIGEVLEKLCDTGDAILEKMKTLIGCYIAGQPDVHSIRIINIRKTDKKVIANIKSLRKDLTEDRVLVSTMAGGKSYSRTDGIRVVGDQIDRNIRIISIILSEMGCPATTGSGISFTADSNIPPTTGSNIPWTLRAPKVLIRRPGIPIREMPSFRRGFSTMAPMSRQTNREQGGGRRSSAQFEYSPSRSIRGPPKGSEFGLRWKKKTPEMPRPRPAPGESVRDKMAEKEKERLSAMNGLTYSLLPGDRQEGGDSSVQKVVEKESFQNVGLWENSGEVGGLTDESGVEPLKKGDMCEIRTGSMSNLAIYLRPSLFGEPTSDFLLMTGEILFTQVPRITFSVPSFVPEESITELIVQYDKIRQASGLGRNDLSQIVLPRKMLSSMLERVRSFSDGSARLYANHRTRFDELYERLALQDAPSTITLFEVVEEIFGSKYGDQELYATHLALMGDGAKFQTDKATHRATSTFTVRSKSDVAMIDFAARHVRKSTSKEDVVKKRRSLELERGQGKKAQLDRFVDKARCLIDLSRKYKKEDILVKRRNEMPVRRVKVDEVVWDKSDMFFIDFVKASVLQHGVQSTLMDSLVPSILRAMDRYTGELNGVVGYQFLTEIGAWGAWENLSLRQQNITFPGYGTSKVTDEDQEKVVEVDTPAAVENMELKDCMKELRKDWEQLEVYCIDDATAHEIDDGISLERVSETENWVHVHIANPTAFLPQNHWLSDVAFRRKQSLYLPEKVYPMLPVSLTNLIGMGPNRGVMTISAKINKNGEILDFNVQAGFVRNVKRFTYDAISTALGEPGADMITYKVGEFPKPSEHPKTDFTKKQLADIRTLSEIAAACRQRRVRDNMVECRAPSYDVSVYDGLSSPIHPTGKSQPFLYRGHPSIRLTIEMGQGNGISHFMVSEIMQLANDATARFCGKNNIAVPFRVMEYDFDRGDMVNHFLKNILPSRDNLGCINFELGLRYMSFLGPTRLSSSPKPHRLMGLEHGYVRATSPLRRYSDMIAHWQIQTYLLGKNPRTHKQLQNIIPEMDRGERLANYTAKDSRRFWGTVAVGRILETDKNRLPGVMEFMVMEKSRFPTPSVGLVTDLGMVGKVEFKSRGEEMSVLVGDILKVTPSIANPGEKFVWYDFQAVARRASMTF